MAVDELPKLAGINQTPREPAITASVSLLAQSDAIFKRETQEPQRSGLEPNETILAIASHFARDNALTVTFGAYCWRPYSYGARANSAALQFRFRGIQSLGEPVVWSP